jgi:hypothetical protein
MLAHDGGSASATLKLNRLPSLVILNMKDYIDTFAPAPEELRAMQATAKRTGARRLTPGQINRIVATVRREQKPSPVKRRSK